MEPAVERAGLRAAPRDRCLWRWSRGRARDRPDRRLSRMPRESRIQTVVLTVRYAVRSSYYEDWLDAFAASPLFSVTSFNLFRRDERRAARRAVANAELVVALHACSADTLEFIK